MAVDDRQARWRTDGKFFRLGDRRAWLRAVTYGPFPGGWPESFDDDFGKITAAGFNAIRLYDMPGQALLDAAARHGLAVFGGLKWRQSADFLRRSAYLAEASVLLAETLRECGGHPALAGVFIGNEVPADLVRWMGPVRVREALEGLISRGKRLAPHLLFAYANYPSTEYLEPENADFTAFNVFLEEPEKFRNYLRRLHHIAGDRPLVISEFGLDSRRNGLDRQRETIRWGLEIARDEETAGITLYAWSDRWWNAGAEVLDWDFGLNDRAGDPKPALAAASGFNPAPLGNGPDFSVIVCTRNGADRIGGCLEAIGRMAGGGFETIVVDDGSTDGTGRLVAARFPWVKLLTLPPSGLSAARNAGASAASGEVLAFTDDDCEPDEEWVARLRPRFANGVYGAVGGPNLPPPARDWREAVVSSAPGAPSHVMLDDVEAEHLPGCNLAVTRRAFAAVGGFDPVFHTAGDDVDFCWRLREAGFRLGFAAGAFVWHWRRPSLRGFLRQQLGYGQAERILLKKHPQRFSARGGMRWHGFVYGGGPVRITGGSVIYHGPMGHAGYQSVTTRMLPLRGLDARFQSWRSRLALILLEILQPAVRAWVRNGRLALSRPRCPPAEFHRHEEFEIASESGHEREHFLSALLDSGWTVSADAAAWDLARDDDRVLLATERGEGIGKRVLARVSGNTAAIRRELLRAADTPGRERP